MSTRWVPPHNMEDEVRMVARRQTFPRRDAEPGDHPQSPKTVTVVAAVAAAVAIIGTATAWPRDDCDGRGGFPSILVNLALTLSVGAAIAVVVTLMLGWWRGRLWPLAGTIGLVLVPWLLWTLQLVVRC